MRAPFVVMAILLVTTPAFALKPGKHAAITKASCRAVRLPSDFCYRVATENYDTDSREWDDLVAHAQISDNETACTAADHTAARIWQRADGLRRAIDQVAARATDDNVGALASELGRALHTIQDNCAHHGMPNPQHAWYSLSDFCRGTELSPDIQDDAIQCAERETDAVMKQVAEAVDRANISRALSQRSCPGQPGRDHTDRNVCQDRFLPSPIDACRFLRSSERWDGVDRQWDNDVAVSALRGAFTSGLAGGDPLASICGGDESVLTPATSELVVDVSGGKPTCGGAHLLCLGKVDDADNPFADDETDEATDGGCAATPSSQGAFALAFGLLIARRRRRR